MELLYFSNLDYQLHVGLIVQVVRLVNQHYVVWPSISQIAIDLMGRVSFLVVSALRAFASLRGLNLL